MALITFLAFLIFVIRLGVEASVSVYVLSPPPPRNEFVKVERVLKCLQTLAKSFEQVKKRDEAVRSLSSKSSMLASVLQVKETTEEEVERLRLLTASQSKQLDKVSAFGLSQSVHLSWLSSLSFLSQCGSFECVL